jgi:ParB-like chromosome segregation protein Spo0J
MLSQVMAQRIEHWKLAELTPYPRNPRRHSDAQIAQIAGSIAAFGFNSPILIDSRGNIIAGHGRYLAALKLGLETVPVVVLADGPNRRMHSNGRVRAGRIRHNGPTFRREAGNHGD